MGCRGQCPTVGRPLSPDIRVKGVRVLILIAYAPLGTGYGGETPLRARFQTAKLIKRIRLRRLYAGVVKHGQRR